MRCFGKARIHLALSLLYLGSMKTSKRNRQRPVRTGSTGWPDHTVAFLAQHIEEVRESVCRHAAEVRGAVNSGDTAALTLSAQHLRRGCDVIGARRMATLAARLEEIGMEVRVQEALRPLMAEFGVEYRAMCRLLDVALVAARTAAIMGQHPALVPTPRASAFSDARLT